MLFFLLSILTWQFSYGQEGILLNTDESMDGFLLIEASKNSSTHQFLINNCGEIVNSWVTGESELHAKLLEDGSLIYLRNNTLFRKDWDNNTIYTFTAPSEIPFIQLVYEVILLPNGNYLCIVNRGVTNSELIDMGWNFNNGTPQVTDGIIEIDVETGEIVWEWNIKDHLIQERSEDLGNYGIVADNPHLLDCDAVYPVDFNNYESFMINGMDYNPELDQIALSVRKVNEIMIIDHSTTTEEASGSSGGNSGMGGDFIYRFGNPQNYGRGDANDRYLFFQHNPNWILHGPHAGKIICFNNGLERPDVFDIDDRWSAAAIFDPVENGFNYILPSNSPFEPVVPGQTYDRFSTGNFFYSSYTSSAKVLANENILITEGVDGRVMELNSAGDLVWEYDLESNQVNLFRTEKYPANYPAFENRDMSSTGQTIEDPSSGYDCNIISSIKEHFVTSEIELKQSQEEITLVHPNQWDYDFSLFDITGKSLIFGRSNFGQAHIDMTSFVSGVYVLSIRERESLKLTTHKILIP